MAERFRNLFDKNLGGRLRSLVDDGMVRRVMGQSASALPMVRKLLGLEGPSSGAQSPVFQVILAQYDRKKYRGSLERLLGALSGLDGLDYRVLVVDNFRPGDWSHEVSERLIHVGGDNSAWEFSAFDKGLAHLERARVRADVYAFVTDAFTAYGSEFLSLISKETVEFAARSRSAVGWVDSWPEATTVFGKPTAEWVRTSFLILPSAVLPIVRPFAFQFDKRAVFSGDPAAPFGRKAPVGAGLQRYIVEWLSGASAEPSLAEGWHSQFRLDRESLPFFESKASAILREQLVSVHLRAASVPYYDLRLLRRLEEGSRLVHDLEPAVLARYAGTHWNDPDEIGALTRFRHHLDRVELPRNISQGDPATVLVEGWVLAATPPSRLLLRVGPKAFAARRDLPRDDVASAFPHARVGRPGFVASGGIGDLRAGAHDVVLDFGDGHTVPLGRIDVIPLIDVAGLQTVIPRSWPRGRAVPVAIYGELRTSYAATSVSTRIDGIIADIPAFLGPPILQPNGVFSQDVTVNGYAGPLDAAGAHGVEVRFGFSDGADHTITYPFTVAAAEHPCTLRHLVIGPFDSDSGLTSVAIEVDLFGIEARDRLVLERDGRTVLENAIVAASGGLVGAPHRDVVAIERRVEGIPPGASPFALVLKRNGERFTLFRGELQVKFLHPKVHVERLSAVVVRSDGAAAHRLVLSGWVEHHFLVDCLHVEVDDARMGTIGLHELRPDVASAMHDPIISRQGFDAHIDVAGVHPGEHVVHVIATQKGIERSRVSRRTFFEDTPSRRLTIISDDVERLRRGEPSHLYSSIVLRGGLQLHMEEATAALLVDDHVADAQTFEGTGRHEFRLRAVPNTSGEHDIRFLVSSQGRVVFSTDPVRVSFRRLELSPSLAQDVGTILDRFDLRSKLLGGWSDAELSNRLVEWQPERISEFTDMVADSAKRLRAANGSVRMHREPRHAASSRRLQILLASWEVPSRYHGGGVYLANLLTRLGARHDITLVHTYGLDEVGHVEAVRPYVRRIIGVPRVFRAAQYRGGGRFPLFLYDVYIPQLRRVMELEVASGAYDLVDYEYSSMGPYIVPGIPSVLTIYETGYTALLNSVFDRASASESVVGDLDQFLRSFHYFTSELPSLCRHLVNLTEEDAVAISTYSDANVYVNSAGVDVEGLPPPVARPRGSAPVVAYVGNFQHPPNARAVIFFAKQVMPELVRRYPAAQFRVYGTRLSAEVRALDGQNGVRVEGFVEDLRSALRDATAMVAPIFTGTGIRIKVLEAFGAGALVIGTDLSVRGLAVVDGRHFYRANTAVEFVRAVSRAFESANEAAAIAQAGYELVAQSHGWDAVARRREAIWQSVLAEPDHTGVTLPVQPEHTTHGRP